MPPFFPPHSAQSNPMRALKGPTRRLGPQKVAGRYRGLAKSLHPAVQHYGVAFPDDPWNSYDYLYCHSARDKIRQPLISLSAIIRRLWIGRFCFPAPLFWLGRATSISAPVQSSSSPVFFFFSLACYVRHLLCAQASCSMSYFASYLDKPCVSFARLPHPPFL